MARNVVITNGAMTTSDDLLPFTPRARAWIGRTAFVLLAYVPLMFMDPGKVEADTKSYLYLDPGRLLAGASSMWDPHIGMGTVSHQTIGYLFPVGPFYWISETVLRMPAWVAQRLWLGTLLCAAGLGIGYLLRTLKVSGPGVPVAMLGQLLRYREGRLVNEDAAGEMLATWMLRYFTYGEIDRVVKSEKAEVEDVRKRLGYYFYRRKFLDQFLEALQNEQVVMDQLAGVGTFYAEHQKAQVSP